jgi:hypothetical protein
MAVFGMAKGRYFCTVDDLLDRANGIVDVFALIVRRGEGFWPPRSDAYFVSGQIR